MEHILGFSVTVARAKPKGGRPRDTDTSSTLILCKVNCGWNTLHRTDSGAVFSGGIFIKPFAVMTGAGRRLCISLAILPALQYGKLYD